MVSSATKAETALLRHYKINNFTAKKSIFAVDFPPSHSASGYWNEQVQFHNYLGFCHFYTMDMLKATFVSNGLRVLRTLVLGMCGLVFSTTAQAESLTTPSLAADTVSQPDGAHHRPIVGTSIPAGQGAQSVGRLNSLVRLGTSSIDVSDESLNDSIIPAALDSLNRSQLDSLNFSTLEFRHRASVDSLILNTPKKKRSLITKVIDYFKNSNHEPKDGQFDVSFIGGPSYSSSTSLEVAAIMAGIYRTGSAATTPLSELDIYAEGSVTGFYNVGIRGQHIFRNDKFRINYNVNFCHFPSKYWGIGYESAANKENETDYTLLQSLLSAEFLWHLPHDIFLGPSLYFDYSKATKTDRPELWGGQKMRQLAYGMGFIFSLDTRDNPHNAHKGYSIVLHTRFFPNIFGTNHGFMITNLTLGWYKQVWKSGVFATQFHAARSTKHTPWSMLPTLDASSGLRGYYEGRYRDKGEMDLVVELRQHLWKRNGMIVWAGIGSVYDKMRDVNIHKLLPSFGVGYRWEFKKDVNVRVDVGFGKRSMAFSLGLNEAF